MTGGVSPIDALRSIALDIERDRRIRDDLIVEAQARGYPLSVIADAAGEGSARSHHWQAEVPERDGWHVVIGEHGGMHLLKLGTGKDGDRVVGDGWKFDYLRDRPIYWWLVPGIPPKPTTNEEARA